MGTGDWVSVAELVISVLATSLVAVIAWVFRDMRRQLTENSRHLQAIMYSTWNLIWRTDSLEDFARDRFQYRPPRGPTNPPFRDGP